jgi:hypothetical protein
MDHNQLTQMLEGDGEEINMGPASQRTNDHATHVDDGPAFDTPDSFELVDELDMAPTQGGSVNRASKVCRAAITSRTILLMKSSDIQAIVRGLT